MENGCHLMRRYVNLRIRIMWLWVVMLSGILFWESESILELGNTGMELQMGKFSVGVV